MQGFTILFEFLAQGVLVISAIVLSFYMANCSMPLSVTGLLTKNPSLCTGLFVVIAYTLGIAFHSLIFSIIQGIFKFQGRLFLKRFESEVTKDPTLWQDVCQTLRIIDISGESLAVKEKLNQRDTNVVLNNLREYLLIHHHEAYNRNVIYRNEYRLLRGLLLPLGIMFIGSVVTLLLDTPRYPTTSVWIAVVAPLAMVASFLLFSERLERYYKMVLGSFRMAFIIDRLSDSQTIPSETHKGKGQTEMIPNKTDAGDGK